MSTHAIARRALPKRVRSNLRAAAQAPQWLPLAADLRTVRQLHRLHSPSTLFGPSEVTVPLRLRPIAGATVRVRPRSADVFAILDTFSAKYHLPPFPAGSHEVRRIWDLGANIGLTMAHFATLFPEAQITGVEMDAENSALCRQNLAAWSDRCEVITAAVWSREGEVSYARERGQEQSFNAQLMVDGDVGTATRVGTLTLDALASRDDAAPIDFVKMDIEGAEAVVLRERTGWAERVRAIKVEVHEPYDVETCRRDLERLGFDATVDRHHWAAVTGTRP